LSGRIELIKEMIAKRDAAANAKVVEGVATRKSDTRTARPRRAEEDVVS